jgi:hypothetical protein
MSQTIAVGALELSIGRTWPAVMADRLGSMSRDRGMKAGIIPRGVSKDAQRFFGLALQSLAFCQYLQC